VRAGLDVFTVDVSPKTTWIFVRLEKDGLAGFGEATLNGRTGDVLAAVPAAAQAASEAPLGLGGKLAAVTARVEGVVGRVVASALEQAALDLEGRRTGRPVHALLSGAHRTLVPVYANINRGTLSRTPEEFAERAALAEGDGYGAVKLAPFDGVTPAPDGPDRDALVEAGFARIAAVAAAVRGRVAIQVDCHSRFRRDELGRLLARVAELGVSWLEEPTAEVEEAHAALAALREAGGRLGVRLVGAENVAGLAAILPFLARACYDVVMPDVLLAGGPAEVVRIGHLAAGLGTAVSLHNPSGPVMDAHSLHAAAALPQFHLLERQFRESGLYDAVVARRDFGLDAGRLPVPQSAGVGLDVDVAHDAVLLGASLTVDL